MGQDRPMVLAVLGEFGGRRERGTRRLRRVDRDSLDTVMGRLGVEVEVPDGDGTATLRLEGMADFHPDALVRRVPGLAAILEGDAAPGRPGRAPQAAPPPAVPPGAGLLDSI